MIKRTLFFENPCYLKKKDIQLVVEYPKKSNSPGDSKSSDESSKRESKSVPIEDIGMIVLENQQITITHGLISALMDNNAAVLSCNGQHMPYGLMLPMAQHHAFTEKMNAQLESSQPLRKNLWQQTIIAKIENQAAVLDSLGIDIENMRHWASQVKSGDPDNYESRAAVYYWDNIFDQYELFRRNRYGGAPNSVLNYGYSILRAIVARSLVGSGLFTALGIHHKNKYNPYCLADDIMEPYRPYVDNIVLDLINEGYKLEQLDIEIKKRLLAIATIDINIDGQTSPLMVGVQRTTASVRKCFEGESRKIVYPVL